jgi:hypothetical protein
MGMGSNNKHVSYYLYIFRYIDFQVLLYITLIALNLYTTTIT